MQAIFWSGLSAANNDHANCASIFRYFREGKHGQHHCKQSLGKFLIMSKPCN